MIEVLEAGLISSLQDAGRPGHAALGIGRAGAADLPALRLANALVGNDDRACAIELTLRGPRLRFHRDTVFALTGAPLPNARCDGRPVAGWRRLHASAGSELQLGAMPTGCRAYLAVAGGIDVEPWLGSRSTDLNAGLGPAPGRALRADDRLATGDAPAPVDEPPHWSLDPRPWFDAESPRVLRWTPGRHTGLLDEASREALRTRPFRVGADSNRVGVRLDGPALKLRQPLELVSEGVVAGVVQLPPGGQPIILLNEHPVTGGYPRVAQLAAVDLPRLAQCRPGDTLHVRWTGCAEAIEALCTQQRMLDKLCADIRRRLEES